MCRNWHNFLPAVDTIACIYHCLRNLLYIHGFFFCLMGLWSLLLGLTWMTWNWCREVFVTRNQKLWPSFDCSVNVSVIVRVRIDFTSGFLCALFLLMDLCLFILFWPISLEIDVREAFVTRYQKIWPSFHCNVNVFCCFYLKFLSKG